MKRKKQRRFISWMLAMLLVMNVFLPAINVRAESDTLETGVLIVNTEETPAPDQPEETPVPDPSEETPAPDPTEDTDIIEETEATTEEVSVASPSVPDKVIADKKQKASVAEVFNSKTVTELLKPFSAKVIQNNADVTESADIDYKKPLSVEISFDVPVLGDWLEDPGNPDLYVSKGDIATFKLGNGFTILAPTSFELNHKVGQQSYKIGTLTLAKNSLSGEMEATVEFNGDEDVFNGNEEVGIHGVTAKFTANLQYDNSNDNGNGKEDSVTILEKTYKVEVPPLAVEYERSKTASIDAAKKEIEWTVKIRAYKATTPESPVDLYEYVFSDDLNTVGEFVPGSVTVNTVSVGDGLVYDSGNETLSYTFPSNSTAEQTIVFRTKISDKDFYSTTSKEFVNNATIKKGEEEVTVQGKKTYNPPQWITKSGKENQTGENYDPLNRTITWSIVIDTNGTSLPDAVVTDILKQNMTFKSAKLEKWDGSSYSNAEKTWNEPAPENSKYELGNISGKYLLTIVATVPNDTGDITGDIITYNNTAVLSWSTYPGTGEGLEAKSPGVGVGYNAISKNGAVKDAKKQLITWKIKVDTKGQSFPNLKAYDLLVYGDSINLNEFTDELIGIDTSHLHPQYNQKYADGLTSTSTNFNLTKKTLTKNGVDVADLLIFEGLNNPGLTDIQFDAKVTNPDFFAANTSKTLWNTASLISGNREINTASDDVSYVSQLLDKEMLKRGSNASTLIGANNKTSDISEGFDYIDKSAVFRLSVNADGLDWTSLKNKVDESLGDVTITDTLPDDWEFVKFDDNSDYYIFNGDGNTETPTSVVAKGTALNPEDVTGLNAKINGQSAEFTFSSLKTPYVILLKARPTDAALKTYFSSNQDTDRKNVLSLTTEQWAKGIKDEQSVRISSKIIDKLTPNRKSDALIEWKVFYNPYSMDISLSDTPEMKIEDKMPEGMELKDGSVIVYEMPLKPDGSLDLTKGTEVQDSGSYIEYLNTQRLLTFRIPDKTKAYQLIYETIITSETAGEGLTNKVTLIGSKANGQETSNVYNVQSSDASASLSFGGYIRINKTGLGDVGLDGATFELLKTGENVPFRTATSKNGGKILMKVLPAGEYTLIETSAPAGYVVSKTTYKIEIVADPMGGPPSTWINGSKANDLTIKNNTDGTVGSLIIKKTVEGSSDKTSDAFNFTVTLSASGNYPYEKSDGTNGIITSGDTISLKHDQTITIFDLPVATTYEIEEEDLTSKGYVTPAPLLSGTITAAAAEAHFTNYQPGSLTIKKQVLLGDTNKPFEFTVSFTKDEKEDTNTYVYTGNGGASGGTIKSGDTLSLSDGQSITISGIGKDTGYNITESDYSSEGYEKPTISGNPSGKISAGEDSSVAFKNSQSLLGGLIISKTVIGNGGNKTKKFTFTVTFDTDGTYDYVGKRVPNGKIKSGDKIELADGQSISISGLLHGTQYTVTEEDYSSDGYKTVFSGNEGAISKDLTAKAEFTNSRYSSGGGNGGGGGKTPKPTTPTQPVTPTPTPEPVTPGEIPQGYLPGPDGNYYTPQQIYDIFGEIPLGFMVAPNGQLVPLGGLPKTGDDMFRNVAIFGLLSISALLGMAVSANNLRKKRSGK